jgi:hypothetical protein
VLLYVNSEFLKTGVGGGRIMGDYIIWYTKIKIRKKKGKANPVIGHRGP